MKADSMRSSSSAVSTMPSGRRWRSCAGGGGVFLCEDAVVCARVYGYCDGTVVEFCLGITCIVIATVSLYIAGMLRDRRVQAEFARRRAERERRRAERENRGW